MAEECRWPEYSEDKCRESVIEIPVQVCGKLRSRITVDPDMSEDDVINAALSDEKLEQFIAGKEIVKKIYVKGKLLNIVVK